MVSSGRDVKAKLWKRQCERLTSRIEECLATSDPQPVNLSIPRHSVTAPVLRALAYDRRFEGKPIPVIFKDGSRPEPFPAGILSDQEETPSPRTLPDVRLGLISFRHPDLDYLVDLYLLTNMQIDRNGNLAVEEQQAFDAAVKTLTDPSIAQGAAIYVYHTGLEPTVIGFYRGVAEVLRSRTERALPRELMVVPCLFAEDPTTGAITPDSPGAKAASYHECHPWW